MGGGSGEGIPVGDRRRLEEKAKESLRDPGGESSRHVFISFAQEDEDEVNLLRGQAKNEKTDLEFDDFSLKEAIKSKDDDYIKRRIREQLAHSSVTMVFLTKDSAKSKWVNWEIEESLRRGKGLVGVYKGTSPPTTLPSAFLAAGGKIVKWSHKELAQAIEEANKDRS